MMLSEKLKDAIVTVPFGLAELDGPPVEPHEVVTSARATILAPRTMIRFRNIAPPPRIAETTPPPSPYRVLYLSVPPSGLASTDGARLAWPAAVRPRVKIPRSAKGWQP